MKLSDIHKIIREELHNIKIDEDIIGWMAGVGKQVAYDIIDRRAKGLSGALKHDPKLLRLAKDLKITSKDLESRINTLLDKDPRFLKALATQRAKRI
jgi:hypothetical protein